jgi:ABC-type nitrate/sulfonate/bicarbonate transport system permease component
MTGLVRRLFAADNETRDVVAVLAASLLLWQTGVWPLHPSALILPAPSAILAAFMETPSLFLRHLSFTLGATCLGFAFAVGLGVGIVSLLLLRLVGTLLFFAVDYAERLCLPWHVSQRARHPRAVERT